MRDSAEVVTLQADRYGRLLESLAEREIAGGAIYDAVIVECALAAEVDTILTFNDRHFRRLAREPLRIAVPGEG